MQIENLQQNPNEKSMELLGFPDISKQKYFQLQNPKYISWEFYKQYSDRTPPFGDLGAIVYLRTYSRFIEQLGRREYWCETVLRVVEYSLSLEDITPAEDKRKEAEALYDMMFNLRGFPAGRTLWVGDKNRKIPSTANFNCSFRVIDSISAYAEIMYLLMVGAGTGFSVQSKYVSKLPKFNTDFKVHHVEYTGQKQSDRPDDTLVKTYWRGGFPNSSQYLTGADLREPDSEYLKQSDRLSLADSALITIGDSREGWVNGLRSYLTLLTYPNIKHISIDYGLIREKGKKLKTFGGRASGYVPLKQFFRKAEWLIKHCGGQFTSVTAMDMSNIIAEVVVVAGVRRSAQISIGDSDDVVFKTAKYKLFNYVPGLTAGISGYDPNESQTVKMLARDYGYLIDNIAYTVQDDEVKVVRSDRPNIEIDMLTRDHICQELIKHTPEIGTASRLDGYGLKTLIDESPELIAPEALISRKGLIPLLAKLYDLWDTTDDRNLEVQRIVDSLDPKYRYRDSRVMSNNSIALEEKPDRTELENLVEFIRNNGEPGLLNYQTGRKRRPDFEGVNPCFTGDMKLLCKTGYYTFRELSELAEVDIIDYRGRLRRGRVWSNGEKGCIELTLDDSVKIRCTPDHILLTEQGAKQAKDCLGLKLMTFDYDLYNQEVLEIEAIAPQEVFDFSLSPIPPEDDEDDTHWGVVEGIVAHNCAEILLRNFGVCNLVEAVLPSYVQNGTFRWNLFESDLRLLTRMASRITMVEMWHPNWDEVQKSDRLLGVSITGQCDAWIALGNPPDQYQNTVLDFAKHMVRSEEAIYHERLGIPRAILTTTVKPSGSISQLPSCSSGCHQPYAPYYFRNVRISSFDPLAKALKDLGCHVQPQKEGKTLEEDDTWVFTFPMKTDAQIKSVDESAIAQLNRYRNLMGHFVEHNASITVSVAPDEWGAVVDWLDQQENWDSFVGISFLPKFDPTVGSDGAYPKMPYVTCTEEQYHSIPFPKFTERELVKLLQKYETSEEEYAIDDSCSTGACPIR